MGPPRRNRSGSTATASTTNSPQLHRARQQYQHPSPAPTPEPSAIGGMSAASRYDHNLKVLRRRDPSIVSIFDQFSHVCVYHHDGTRWEKQGFEGTMFLYERESYPPYGFYILNRVGMEDYIQRLYPEDSMQAHDKYLMMRSYPAFTARRLSLLPQNLDGKFAPEYAVPELADAVKGESVTFGLWCFATDARDPMQDVMIRLHSYIKKNLPYPDIYKYAPDRPPPAHGVPSTNGTHGHSAQSSYSQSPLQQQPTVNGHITSGGNAGSSLDALFSKMTSPVVGSGSNGASVENLFSALSPDTTGSPAPPAAVASSGLALLNSIFASASPSPATAVPSTSYRAQDYYKAQAQQSTISPKPTPQILTQDVIYSLMGLTPSQYSPSNSSSSSRRSHNQYKYEDEGDIESDGGSVSVSVSSTSTVLDLDAEEDMELMAAGASAGIPLLSVPGSGSGGYGDRTPRAIVRDMEGVHGVGMDGVRTSTPPLPQFTPVKGRGRGVQGKEERLNFSAEGAASALSRDDDTTTLMKSSSSTTIKAHFSPTPAPPVPSLISQAAVPARTLVPFSADSELWPYPRAPVNEDAEGEEVVELDFADISKLSDGSAFLDAGKAKKGKGRKEEKEGNGKKKGKKERAEEREKEREAIEKSWDVPVSSALVDPAPPNVGNGKARVTVNGSKAVVDQDAVRASIGASLEGKSMGGGASRMLRNEFVREVLMLIHTDKNFVEQLWREYTLRTG